MHGRKDVPHLKVQPRLQGLREGQLSGLPRVVLRTYTVLVCLVPMHSALNYNVRKRSPHSGILELRKNCCNPRCLQRALQGQVVWSVPRCTICLELGSGCLSPKARLRGKTEFRSRVLMFLCLFLVDSCGSFLSCVHCFCLRSSFSDW